MGAEDVDRVVDIFNFVWEDGTPLAIGDPLLPIWPMYRSEGEFCIIYEHDYGLIVDVCNIDDNFVCEIAV